MKAAVIYARYSSKNQSEMSISGQLKECYAYAKREGYNVIREYIDRAMTGTNDKRKDFQKMLKDSEKGQFDTVIVYQLDRFMRNRYESAIHKSKLKKHGVKVVSARENIGEDASGILMESVLEGMAEYYSAELSQKVKRGIALSVEKCKFIGGFVPLGYVVDKDKYYQLDPVTAPVVQKCFELYAAGNSLREISEIITEQFGSYRFGNGFNTLNRMFSNRNYIGVYTRGGSEVKEGMPRIVSDELFERVHQILNKNKKAPARARAHEEYLLTTKLFCGYDREMMVGVSGTSKSGKIHSYYTCKNVWRKKGCKKKNVKKSYIEDFIVSEARKQLTDENIDIIVQAVCEASKQENNAPHIAEIKRNIKENAKAIDNLLDAIERGENLDLYNDRLTKRKQEKINLETMLAKAQYDTIELDEKEVKFFFHQLQKGSIDDERSRKALIAILINEVSLYDDKVRIIFNASDRPIVVDVELLNEIESLENGQYTESGRCSYMKDTAPPSF